MRCLLVLGLLLTSCASTPSSPPQDLHELVAFVRRVHPAPHRYVSAEQLDAALARAEAEVGPTPDPLVMARETARLVAQIGDAHLMVGLERPPESDLGVPLYAVEVEGQLLVDAAATELAPGTELLELEGWKAQDLLPAMAGLVAVDGARAEVAREEAQRRFSELATLLLGSKPHYRLTLRAPDGEVRTELWPALSGAERRALAQTRSSAARWDPSETSDPTLLRLPGAGVRLRLPAFSSRDDAHYEAKVRELMTQALDEPRLVIDLRGNAGGYRHLGVFVLQHLIARPFTQWRSAAVRTRNIPEAFADRVSWPIAPEASLTEFPGQPIEDRWVFEGDPLAERMTPMPRIYAGELILFVDGATNSAAIEFAAALLAHRPGVRVIGTPTRGACDRHTGQIPVAYRVGQGVALLMSVVDIELVPVPGCRPGSSLPLEPVVYRRETLLAGGDPFLTAL